MARIDSTIDNLVEVGSIDTTTAERAKEKAAEKVAEKVVNEEEEALNSPEQAQEITQPAEQPDALPPQTELATEQQAPVDAAVEQAPLTPEQLEDLSIEQAQDPSQAVNIPEQTPALIPEGDQFAEAQRLAEQSSNRAQSAEVAKTILDQRKLEAQATKRAELENQKLDKLAEIDQQLIRNQEEQTKAIETFTKLKEELDSNPLSREQFINNMSTGRKIAAFIGIALGGLGGGANESLRAFENSIDKELALQERQRASKIKRSQNIIDLFQQQFQNKKQVRAATEAYFAGQIKTDLQRIADRFAGTEAGLKAQKAIATFESKEAEALRKVSVEQAKQREKFGRAQAVEGRELPSDFNIADLPKSQRDRVTVDLPSINVKQFIAKVPKKQLDKENTDLSVADDSITRMREALEYAKANPTAIKVTGFEERAVFQSMLNELIGAMRVPITGPGVLTQADIDMIRRSIGDPSKRLSWGPNQRKVMEQVISRTKVRMRSALKRLGHKKAAKAENIKSFKEE